MIPVNNNSNNVIIKSVGSFADVWTKGRFVVTLKGDAIINYGNGSIDASYVLKFE